MFSFLSFSLRWLHTRWSLRGSFFAAITEIAGLNTSKEHATVPSTEATEIQQRLDETERLHAEEIKHVRAQQRRETRGMLDAYNGLMTLYQRKCQVVDKHTRAAAQIKVNFRVFGSEIRVVTEDRDAKAEEIKYLRALLAN